ncbi:MAG TPA: RtcB family protein [Stellaceae bacterium]|nr:RtcB family protein [Stellaceae bacterium]
MKAFVASHIMTWRLHQAKFVRQGAEWALGRDYAIQEDLDHTEEGGRLPMAQPEKVSELAYHRGRRQLGTLGWGSPTDNYEPSPVPLSATGARLVSKNRCGFS